jgi:hypothetical protein
MPRYVSRDGYWFDKDTGEPLEIPPGRGVCMPTVRSDIAEYTSPIDGRRIDGRREQREDLKRNDCVLSERPRTKFDPEEYAERKQRQAKYLEQRKAGLV